MKYFVGFIGLLITALFANAQKQIEKFQLIRDIYAEWELHHINIPQTSCDTFFYVSNLYPTVLSQLKKSVNEKKIIFKRVFISPSPDMDSTKLEKIVFTDAEVDSIGLQIDFIQQLAWPENMFENSKMLPMDTVDNLLDQIQLRKDSLLKKLCYKIHIFSMPILFRNNTLCLFYSAKADILSHFGRFCLYRKENNNWKEFAIIANAWNR